ncbi:hypothetical protein MMC26_004938 [Xylographa opegraphella]|nr:hypothetical protein [Xylographa opegraphella]
MGSLQPSQHSDVVRDYELHSSAQKVSTQVAMTSSLRAQYPGMILSVVALSACDLKAFAKAGYATFVQDSTVESHYRTSPNQFSEDQSCIQADVIVEYRCKWEGHDFIVYNVEVSRPYQQDKVYSFILTQAREDESVYGSSAATEQLIKRVAEWTAKSHNEI